MKDTHEKKNEINQRKWRILNFGTTYLKTQGAPGGPKTKTDEPVWLMAQLNGLL